MRLAFVIAAAALLIAGTSRALAAEFDLSVGYSHLSLDGSERFKERDGVRIEPRISFMPVDSTPQLRLGFGLGLSGYAHELDSDTIIIIDNGDEIHTGHLDQWETLTLLEPEFQISWRQILGDRGWYVEPGVGIGAVVANYGIVDDWGWSDEDDSEWDSTFAARPFVRVGYWSEGAQGKWVFGAEVSYLFGGSVDLTEQVHGDVREFYAGGFFGVRW